MTVVSTVIDITFYIPYCSGCIAGIEICFNLIVQTQTFIYGNDVSLWKLVMNEYEFLSKKPCYSNSPYKLENIFVESSPYFLVSNRFTFMLFGSVIQTSVALGCVPITLRLCFTDLSANFLFPDIEISKDISCILYPSADTWCKNYPVLLHVPLLVFFYRI